MTNPATQTRGAGTAPVGTFAADIQRGTLAPTHYYRVPSGQQNMGLHTILPTSIWYALCPITTSEGQAGLALIPCDSTALPEDVRLAAEQNQHETLFPAGGRGG